MKNVEMLTEDGAFALFFRPQPGGFDSSGVQKNVYARDSARGRGGGGRLGAAEIDWCIMVRYGLAKVFRGVKALQRREKSAYGFENLLPQRLADYSENF